MIMGLYGKIKKSVKKGLKKWTRCNWPELSLYCGCCELAIGIYIRCVATVVVTTATIIFNFILLLYLINARRRIRNADMSTLEDLLEEATDSESDLNGVFMILDGVVAYFIFWSLFKLFYIIRNILTIYAVYKKSRRTLKVLLYIGVPCWIFDGCLSIIATILLRYFIKGMLLMNFMFEGYNLLAVHSKYKEFSGKSRIVKDVNMPPEMIRRRIINTIETPTDTSVEPHCVTCKCYDRHEDSCPHANGADNLAATLISTASTIAGIWTATADTSNSNENKSEDLNFKDSPIIFNQDILEGYTAMATPTTTSSPLNRDNIRDVPKFRPQRPTTLAIRPIVVKEENTDLCDSPVIYDEGQFNVGTSPIIERV